MDENVRATLRTTIQSWIEERQSSLIDQMMASWRQGMASLTPDEALLDRLAEAAESPAEDLFESADTNIDQGLTAGIDLLENSASQGEILKHLLDALQPFAERSALFVLKQGIANLYVTKGFEPDVPKSGAPVVPPPELEAMIQGKTLVIEGPGAPYAALLAPISRFEASDIRILPLHLRRKTVAVLMVDSGLRQNLSHLSAIRALVYTAEARLSFLASAKEEEAKPAPAEARPNERTMRIPETVQEPAVPPLDPKVRANAERSARVLVGDVELYFPQKVAMGRQQGNLYGLLRDELDRSRASFVERYGADLETQHRIFYQTVVTQLCEGDAAKLGPAPWAPRG